MRGKNGSPSDKKETWMPQLLKYSINALGVMAAAFFGSRRLPLTLFGYICRKIRFGMYWWIFDSYKNKYDNLCRPNQWQSVLSTLLYTIWNEHSLKIIQLMNIERDMGVM